ncbi:hypothetical protein [Streptomyces sp. ME02-8801-2C]|uniref:hypothetical protein n=1 Tax=Streptomyces sp. ME02-8801-2C TaxID=3028680 RepID=UPI0029BFE0D4|nr:hypothetical protein [Streptomyces sp. ME02-8801-2C]
MPRFSEISRRPRGLFPSYEDEELLADPHYLGRRKRLVTDVAYEELVESLVSAVEAELPGTLLHWENFATAHARPFLTRYQARLLLQRRRPGHGRRSFSGR